MSNKTQYVVSVSGGAGSTLALERCISKHGVENTLAIFADTNTEHKDLYTLIEHIQKRHPKLIFVHLKNDGQTIWDIFNKHGIIRTPTGACKASTELKARPLISWIKENCDLQNTVIVSGLEYTEPERRERFSKKWNPVECWHPLADEPILSNCQIRDAILDLGYPTQTLYERRYPHNNCGGGCVLAGQSQWAALLLEDPETFEYHLEREKDYLDKNADKNKHPILRSKAAHVVMGVDGLPKMSTDTRGIRLTEFKKMVYENKADLRDFKTACGCFMGDQLNFFDMLKPENETDCEA